MKVKPLGQGHTAGAAAELGLSVGGLAPGLLLETTV